jgi:hypothetical protein
MRGAYRGLHADPGILTIKIDAAVIKTALRELTHRGTEPITFILYHSHLFGVNVGVFSPYCPIIGGIFVKVLSEQFRRTALRPEGESAPCFDTLRGDVLYCRTPATH